MVVGAMPGMGAVMIIGILLPATYTMNPVWAILLLSAIFKGASMGGGYASILLNVPGTPSAAATAFDGHPLAAQGNSRKALEATIYGSGIAGIIADISLILGVGFLANVALGLGSPEKFMILLFSLLVTGVLITGSIAKGLISIALGLLLGCVGLDPASGMPRLDIVAGIGHLNELDSTAVLVGMLALPEIIMAVPRLRSNAVNGVKVKPMDILGEGLTLSEVKESLKAGVIGTFIGIFFGALPGLGATPATFTSYSLNKMAYGGTTKSGVKFGKGAVPGVFATETANSATSGSSLIPLLTLGIPGDVVAALLLAAFMLHGITPGPGIMTNQADMVYTIFAGLLLSDFLNLVLGILTYRPICMLLRSQLNVVYPVITLICLTGIYSVNSRMLDVGIFLFMGVLACILKYFKIPLAPIAIGFVLSRNLETAFRSSLGVSNGSFSIFVSSPVCIFMLIIIFALVVWLVYVQIQEAKAKRNGTEDMEREMWVDE